MKFSGFLNEIDETDYLFFILDACDEKSLVIYNENTEKKYKVPIETIQKHNFKNLKRILDGGNPQPLYQMTRVVGYFSKVDMWNKGKKQELKDRTHFK